MMRERGRRGKRHSVVSVGRILAYVGIQNRNFRECRIAE